MTHLNKIIKTLVILALLCSFQIINAQKKTDDIPQWVKMMDNPDVNYFEAIKEFDNYWKDKEKPCEENEIFKKNTHFVKDKIDTEPLKYTFEYKKFLNWERSVLPFVQENGHILSRDERLEIWESERRNRN